MFSNRVLCNVAAGLLMLVIAGPVQSQPNTITAERQSPSARLYFPSTAKVTSYTVDGYVKVTGSTKFIFPISDNGRYRPIAASADGTLAAYYAADPNIAITSKPGGGNYGPLPSGAPFATGSKDTNVGKVSNKEYWDINGTNLTKITLTWNAESGIGELLNNGSLSLLYIVAWNGTKWIKLPAKFDATSILGGQSSLTAGSITTISAIKPGTYNVYTFGADPVAPAPAKTLRVASALDEQSESPENEISDESVSAYPNPVTERLFISNNIEARYISLINTEGRELVKSPGIPKSGIDVSRLTPGFYILKIVKLDGKLISKKILVTK